MEEMIEAGREPLPALLAAYLQNETYPHGNVLGEGPNTSQLPHRRGTLARIGLILLLEAFGMIAYWAWRLM